MSRELQLIWYNTIILYCKHNLEKYTSARLADCNSFVWTISSSSDVGSVSQMLILKVWLDMVDKKVKVAIVVMALVENN